MGTALLIGLTGALGYLALGIGVFVLDKPPPARSAGLRVRMRLSERLSIPDAAREALQKGTYGQQQ